MRPCSCGHVYYKASHQVQFLPNTGVAALFHNPCQFQQCDQSGITLCQIKIWHSGFQRLEFQKDRSELKCDFRSFPPPPQKKPAKLSLLYQSRTSLIIMCCAL